MSMPVVSDSIFSFWTSQNIKETLTKSLHRIREENPQIYRYITWITASMINNYGPQAGETMARTLAGMYFMLANQADADDLEKLLGDKL